MEFAVPHIGVLASGLAAVFEIARVIYTSAQKAACFKDDCKKLASYVHRVEGVLFECEDQLCAAGEAATASVTEIKEAFVEAKTLICKCGKSGRIKAIIQAEDVTHKFQSISMRICNALNLLPFHQLKIANQQLDSIRNIQHDLKRVEFAVCKGLEQQSSELRRMVQIVSSSGDQTHTMLREIMEMLAVEKGERLSKQEVESAMAELREEIQVARANKEHMEEEYMQQVILLLSSGDAWEAKASAGRDSQDNNIPRDLLCPISFELMRDPVILVESGHTYDRPNIEEWLRRGHRKDPCTGAALAQEPCLISNITVKKLVHQWLEDHAGDGIQARGTGSASPRAPSPSSPLQHDAADSLEADAKPTLYPSVNPSCLPQFIAPPSYTNQLQFDVNPEPGYLSSKAAGPQTVLAFHMQATQGSKTHPDFANGTQITVQRNDAASTSPLPVTAAFGKQCAPADGPQDATFPTQATLDATLLHKVQQLQAQLESNDSNQQVVALVGLVNMCKSDMDVHGAVCGSKILLQLVQLLGQQEALLSVLALRTLDVLAVEGKPDVHQHMAEAGVVQGVVDILSRNEPRDADLVFQCLRLLHSMASSPAVWGLMLQAGLVPQLTRVLSCSTRPEVLKVGCQVLCRVVYDPAVASDLVGRQGLLPIVAGLMKSPDEEVRSEGLLLLGQLGEHQQIDDVVTRLTGLNLATVNQLLSSDNAQVRSAGIAKLQGAQASHTSSDKSPRSSLHPTTASASVPSSPTLASASMHLSSSSAERHHFNLDAGSIPVPAASAESLASPPTSCHRPHAPSITPAAISAVGDTPAVSMPLNREVQSQSTSRRRFTTATSSSVAMAPAQSASEMESKTTGQKQQSSLPHVASQGIAQSDTAAAQQVSLPSQQQLVQQQQQQHDTRPKPDKTPRKSSLQYSALLDTSDSFLDYHTTSAKPSSSSPQLPAAARKSVSVSGGIDLCQDSPALLPTANSAPCISRELTFAPRVAPTWVPESASGPSKGLWLPQSQSLGQTPTRSSLPNRPLVGGSLSYSMLSLPDEEEKPPPPPPPPSQSTPVSSAPASPMSTGRAAKVQSTEVQRTAASGNVNTGQVSPRLATISSAGIPQAQTAPSAKASGRSGRSQHGQITGPQSTVAQVRTHYVPLAGPISGAALNGVHLTSSSMPFPHTSEVISRNASPLSRLHAELPDTVTANSGSSATQFQVDPDNPLLAVPGYSTQFERGLAFATEGNRQSGRSVVAGSVTNSHGIDVGSRPGEKSRGKMSSVGDHTRTDQMQSRAHGVNVGSRHDDKGRAMVRIAGDDVSTDRKRMQLSDEVNVKGGGESRTGGRHQDRGARVHGETGAGNVGPERRGGGLGESSRDLVHSIGRSREEQRGRKLWEDLHLLT